MLYPDHIEQRFTTARDTFALVASVAGNMLLGSLLLGTLLMAPLWLHRLLLPLL